MTTAATTNDNGCGDDGAEAAHVSSFLFENLSFENVRLVFF